jgi:hypothetical protein
VGSDQERRFFNSSLEHPRRWDMAAVLRSRLRRDYPHKLGFYDSNAWASSSNIPLLGSDDRIASYWSCTSSPYWRSGNRICQQFALSYPQKGILWNVTFADLRRASHGGIR